MRKRFLVFMLASFSFQALWAASELAPAMPDLTLPAEAAAVAANAPAAPAVAQPPAAPNKQAAARKPVAAKKNRASRPAMPPVTNAASKVNTEEIVVENLMAAADVAPVPAVDQGVAPADAEAVPVAGAVQAPSDAVQPPAEKKEKKSLVLYNPPTDRDPTLSPDDTLLLKHREEERLRALEAERRRKIEEERRRLAEIERQRQLELERLRDPSREIRGKIRVSGIIGQEAFIGNKIYSVGQSVLGARIVSVQPDAVVFTYKGQRFTKRVQLK